MCRNLLSVLALIVSTVTLHAQTPTYSVRQAGIEGRLDQRDFVFSLTLDLTTTHDRQRIDVISGDVTLVADEQAQLGDGVLSYDLESRTYRMTFARAGHHEVTLRFAARAAVEAKTDAATDEPWHHVSFALTAAQTRPITLHADRADLDIDLPGAVRVQRTVNDGRLTVTAMQGGQEQFELRWKAKVQALDAELVVSSEVNAIAAISVDALRLDTLLQFDIAQGRLEQVSLSVPVSLNVTQVRGPFIRDWRLDPLDQQHRLLVVSLNRPQTEQYRMQVLAEMPLPAFPTAIDLPAIAPTGHIRGSGHLALGTDSAIQLLVQSTTGLAQINAEAMPRAQLDDQHPRPIPGGKLFCYSFPGQDYHVQLTLDNISPAYDVVLRHVLRLETEDALLDSEIEVDVRDAPLRELTLLAPAGFTVVSASGAAVADYRVLSPQDDVAGTPVRVIFAQPVLGRSLVQLKLELGRSPLDQLITVTAPQVQGAANQRGYLLVAAEQGLQLAAPKVESLREVAAASAPMRVPEVQFAYRFRDADWSIQLQAGQRPPGLRMEAFHLVSLADNVAYGSVAVSYFITGSPIEQLQFVIALQLDNIQFVGRDVRRWQQDADDPTLWTVTLQRKVIGDYNLGITWTQRYSDAGDVLIGGIRGQGVETQLGYVAVASHLNLKLASQPAIDSGLLAIDRQELPDSYRTLVNAPLLQSYKYVTSPHELALHVDAYERGTLTPVVIELMRAQTQVVPRDDGPAESVTRIRYKIKNSSSQFLTLTLPVDASAWSARLIERDDNGSETSRRVAASVDPATQRLLIPLPRQRDPNEPITVELEYGQVHHAAGWSGLTTFTMPVSDVRSTFDSWTISVPQDWAILSQTDQMHDGDTATLLRAIGASWAQGCRRFFSNPAGPTVGIAALALLGALVIARPRTLPDAVAAMMLLVLLWIGILAGTSSAFTGRVAATDDLTTFNYTRVIDLDREEPPVAQVRIVPRWRQHATFIGAVVAPGVALLCLAAAIWWRKLRPLLLAIAGTGLVVAACQFPLTGRWLGYLLTWGLPAVLTVVYLWRLLRWQWSGHAGSAALAAACFALMTFNGCAATPTVDPQVNKTIVLNHLQVNLTAERDSLACTLDFELNAAEPARVMLLPADAILLDHANLQIQRGQEGYDLVLQRGGRYQGQVNFLLPLTTASDGQSRRFDLPLPPALSKRMTLDIPTTGLDVGFPGAGAIHVTSSQQENATHVEALLGPADNLSVCWSPRARQRAMEQTVFYATTTSAVKFDAGLIEARHELHLEIAQGELSLLHVQVPTNMTVTAVQGPNVGAWRYDPAAGELEVHLSRPAAGDYRLRLVTQIAAADDNDGIELAPLRVAEAARQRGAIGLLTSDAVDIAVPEHPPTINTADLSRDAAELLSNFGSLRFACRANEASDRLRVNVFDVQPEIRSMESANFTVADERLVNVSGLDIEIIKAGVFALRLAIPEGYDIDALSADGMSHWDEQVENGSRVATIHFASKRIGPVPVHVALSRPMTGLPTTLDVPRVEVLDSLKHEGRLVISAERGVRLTASGREGVSELNPTDLGIREQGALAFRLLRPQWTLTLGTEVIEPRITADSLHVATVSEGLVRHVHYLVYSLRHAGVKELNVRVESGALGLQISGPNIARRQLIDEAAGVWRIELTGKWYDPTYPLTISYETRYERADEKVAMHPVIAEDADLQTCYIAARAADRVELTPQQVGSMLQPADSRTIPRQFGAGDLSDAALAYRSASAEYDLVLGVKRHAAADLLAAEVRSADVVSVISETGQAIHRVQLELLVTSKRNLEMQLPPAAEVWSLMVNGRAALPSVRREANGEPVYLAPLAQSAAGDLPVSVDLVYVTPAGADWQWSHPTLQGPRFDLPLQNVHWVIYAPQDYRYDNFAGTMTLNETQMQQAGVADYGVEAYEQEVRSYQRGNIAKAIEFQSKGNDLAGRGDSRAAKQALENAYNYSLGDTALNEDARVQLNRLTRDQALLGLVESRGRLRQMNGPAPQQAEPTQQMQAMGFEQINRLRASLSQTDSENLEMIISQLIETQEAAAGVSMPMVVSMPLRGRVLTFERSIQVEPDAAMTVSFHAEPVAAAVVNRPFVWPGGVLLVLLLIFAVWPRVMATANRWRMDAVSVSAGQAADDGFFDEPVSDDQG